ncbi:MAG: cobalamin-independent methionine synthase II family protein [Planctomycetes bacterium]|nr:cobalamin-independent methionine synthase II family protein [Planctomycetota bacterium]
MPHRLKKLPLFPTQVIGSLPRTQSVRALLFAGKEGRMKPKEFEARMDEHVIFAIRLQELAGIDILSDGEWRRHHYVEEFTDRVGGFQADIIVGREGILFPGVVGKMRYDPSEPIFYRDAEFLVKNTTRVPKFALPSPYIIMRRYWSPAKSTDAYPTRESFIEHLSEILHHEAMAVVQAGVDVVQLDDPLVTYFCDPDYSSRKKVLADTGVFGDMEDELALAITHINRVFEGVRARRQLHCCHAVYKRRSDVLGHYTPILGHLLQAEVQDLNLEFAYAGTGKFTDLRKYPSDRGIGVGCVDVRLAPVPQPIEILRRIDGALKFVSPQQVLMNPDCGFAPHHGEPPQIDEAFNKLKALSEAASLLRRRAAGEDLRALLRKRDNGPVSHRYHVRMEE